MSELRTVMNSLRPTASSSSDYISVKSILQARKEIEPQLLNLTNRIIATSMYPDQLKITKILPIPKPPKDRTLIEGWRPIKLYRQ